MLGSSLSIEKPESNSSISKAECDSLVEAGFIGSNGTESISGGSYRRSCSKLSPHRGWAVVVAFFISFTICHGISNSCGLFFLEWMDYFEGSSRSEISWIGSTLLGMTQLFAPVGAMLSEKYGDRRVSFAGSLLAAGGLAISAYVSNVYLLIFTFGVLVGFGFALVIMIMIVAPIYHFEERHSSLAIGIGISGYGFGSFALPPIIEKLITIYAWQGTLLLCGGIALNLCVCSCVLRPKTNTIEHKKKGSTVYSSMFRKQDVVIYLVALFLVSNGLSTIFVHIAAVVEESTGVGRSESAMVISIIGIVNCIGRIIHGAIAGIKSVNILTQYLVSNVMDGIITLILPHISMYAAVIALSVAFGFFVAGYGVLTVVVARVLVGIEQLKIYCGILSCICGIGWMTGAPIAGLLYDVTGNYSMSMYFGGAAMLVSQAIFLKIWINGSCRGRDDLPKVIDVD